MLIMSLGCLQFSREPCLLYTFLLGYLPSIFCDFGEKPIDFYLQDSFQNGYEKTPQDHPWRVYGKRDAVSSKKQHPFCFLC